MPVKYLNQILIWYWFKKVDRILVTMTQSISSIKAVLFCSAKLANTSRLEVFHTGYINSCYLYVCRCFFCFFFWGGLSFFYLNCGQSKCFSKWHPVALFSAHLLALDLYRSWMEGTSAPMILSADMIVLSSLALSCFVAELNQTVIDMHRTDWMMIV